MKWTKTALDKRRRKLVAELSDAARGASAATAAQLRDVAQGLRDFAHPDGALVGDAPFDLAERSWIVTRAWESHTSSLAERLGRNSATRLPSQDVIAAGVTLARTLYEIWPLDEGFADLLDVALSSAFTSGKDPRWVGSEVDVYGPKSQWEGASSDGIVWVCHGYFLAPTIEDLLQSDLYVSRAELVAVMADHEPAVGGQRVLRQSAASVTDLSYDWNGDWVRFTGNAGRWQLVPDHSMAYANLVDRISRESRRSKIKGRSTS